MWFGLTGGKEHWCGHLRWVCAEIYSNANSKEGHYLIYPSVLLLDRGKGSVDVLNQPLGSSAICWIWPAEVGAAIGIFKWTLAVSAAEDVCGVGACLGSWDGKG